MNDEIQGGTRRFTHTQYGLMAIAKVDREHVRYNKKSWVPRWLWNLLGTPCPYDLTAAAMARAEKSQRERIEQSLNALNQGSPTKLTAKEWKEILEDEL